MSNLSGEWVCRHRHLACLTNACSRQVEERFELFAENGYPRERESGTPKTD